ncbi:MAG: hypothetical protein R3B94_06770 [Hyphomonas sp.]
MTQPSSNHSSRHLPSSTRVSIPVKWKRYGGRKIIIVPDSPSAAALPAPRDESMVKAIARGFRWRQLIDDGTHATIDDLAAAENINASYVSRLLRLSLLAPSIVTAVLDGTQPPLLQLQHLLKPFPSNWEEQRRHFGFDGASA